MKMKKMKSALRILGIIACMLMITFITMVNFYHKIQKREFTLQLNSLRDLSTQGTVILENKLEGFVSTLYGLSEIFEDGHVHDEEKVEKVRQLIKDEKLEFQRVGIADSEGISLVSNGAEVDIHDKDYFQKCMNGEQFAITENRESVLSNVEIFIVAVPILDAQENPKGVLYGVMETERFRLYEKTSMDGDSEYMEIIDHSGNYIMRQRGADAMTDNDNLFQAIEDGEVEIDISLEKMQSQIQKGSRFIVEAKQGKEERVTYFSPLEINNWYVVMVMKKSDVMASVQYLLDNDIYLLIGEVLGVACMLTAVFLYSISREKKKIEKINQQLKFNEMVFQITSKQSNYVIMTYDMASKKLRFLNENSLNLDVPEVVEKAPETLLPYLPKTEETAEQVQRIFQSVGKSREKQDFYLSLLVEGKERIFQIQVSSLLDTKNEITQCVGLMKDITEEVQLRKKADTDQLTGLFNRTSGVERIETETGNLNLPDGVVHAFMILDLDNFKTLNDTLGHQIGDKALKEVGKIMHHHFRAYDIVCRLGGDEFVVFLKNIPVEAIGRNVESLLKKLHLKYCSNGQSVEISASMGIALVPQHGRTFTELYNKADRALYQVKQEGKNGFKIYEEKDER